MSNILYRRMTFDDVIPVQQIEQSTFPLPWTIHDFEKEMTVNRCARYVVAEEEGEILGFAGAWIVLDESHVTNIAVKRERRGEGIGKGLVDALMQYASNLGAASMMLEVRKSNLIAQNLYASRGFVRLGVRKKYYEDNGEDALLMACDQMPPAEADFCEEETLSEPE